MTDVTCAAFVLAGTIVAPHYRPHPVPTPALAISAAYQQLAEEGYHYGSKAQFTATLSARRSGSTWVLNRNKNGKTDIVLDVKSGCIQKTVAID